MSEEDNVNKIKSYIEDILGTKSSLRKKLPIKKSKVSFSISLKVNSLIKLFLLSWSC